MKTTKSFTIGAVLSVTTGRLVCDIGDVYDILNHITGDNLFTHVLPRACRFAEPLILEAFPELKLCGLESSLASLDRWVAADKTPRKTECAKMWLAELKMMHPEITDAYDIPTFADRWLSFDPVEELEGMFGKDKVAVVLKQ